MSYTQKTVRSGNLNRGSSIQPGPSKNVLPPTSSRTVQQVGDADPLADYEEEGYDLMDVLDSMNAGDSVQVEEFKEEEYELEEYVLLDRSESADACPQPKRVRFDSDTSVGSSFSRQFQTTGRATPVTNKKVIVQGSQLAGSAGTPVKMQLKSATQTYTPVISPANAATKSSQVRVVPTERLRMAPTTTSNNVNTGVALSGVQANSFTVPPEKKMMVQYAPVGTTAGSPVVQVNQNVKSRTTPPPLQAYGTKQLHVKIVPLNTLNSSQMQQLKAPLAGIASAVKGDQLAAKALQAGAGKPPGAMSISVVPITPNKSSTSQGYTLSTNSIKLMAPHGTNSVKPSSVDPLAPSPIKPTVVQLKNSSVTITRVVPPAQETEEKCTVDLDTLEHKQSVLQEDPLATNFEQPGSVPQSSIVPMLQALTSSTHGDPLATDSQPPVSVQQGSTSHTVSRMIPIRKPISSTTPGDPLATSSAPPTMVKLMNTSLTVTRLGDQSAAQVDPLATGSAQPVAPRPTSTSLTVTRILPTMPQNGLQSGVNVGASTSTKPPPVQLKKSTVTVTKIVPSSVPQSTPSAKAAAPVRTPTVTARPHPQRPLSNGQYMRKKCDCRVEIAKRLKLLDERTRQMESYMNDLIDLIQPDTEFEVNPITNRDELERLNYDLGSSPQYLQKVKTWLDRRINGRESHWRMVDTMNLLFDNAFLVNCSWKTESKIPLYSYTYIIELFKFIGTTPQVKVTIVCVGNFFMKQIKSLQAKAKKISQGSTAKDANNPENASNEKQATNEEGTTTEKDAANQEDTIVQNDTTVQKDTTVPEETTDRVDASHQESTTNVSHTIIEQEINSQDGEEYLDDEYLEDPTYQDDSQTMSSDD